MYTAEVIVTMGNLRRKGANEEKSTMYYYYLKLLML